MGQQGDAKNPHPKPDIRRIRAGSLGPLAPPETSPIRATEALDNSSPVSGAWRGRLDRSDGSDGYGHPWDIWPWLSKIG